jgi:hypothetical protein
VDVTRIVLGSLLTGAVLAAVGVAVMPYYVQGSRPADYGPIPQSWRSLPVGMFATGFFASLGVSAVTKRPMVSLPAA